MMNPKQRIFAVNHGQKADRIPFMPTIFEHGAAILGQTPSRVAQDEKLMEDAHVSAYELYRHDFVTVGIDVYNIEAEAIGCEVRYHDDNSIPGIISHPYGKGDYPDKIRFSVDRGRINTVLAAAEKINRRIGHEVYVGTGICGPFSIAAELAGFEHLVMDCIDENPVVVSFLEEILQFQKKYCDEIIRRGLGITIFESWASPPLVSPEVYRGFAKPYEKQLIDYVKSKGAASVPLVIGGDTSGIVDDIIDTGTTLIVADYKVDAAKYVEKGSHGSLTVRGNIDPKIIEKGTKEEIISNAERLINKSGGYERFVLGTGVISYGTPPENILAIRKFLEEHPLLPASD